MEQGDPASVGGLHDFGAWVAYSWALLFPADFKSPYFEQTSVVIADSGHFVPEEQPEAFAKALREFLAA